jgi:nitrogen regulatory protein PII
MKLIVATIQTENWKVVQEALNGSDGCLIYASAVGDLRETLLGSYRGASFTEPRPRTRLEIIVMNDLVVQDVVDTIMGAAATPNMQGISNGSIFVLPLDEWIRIPANRPRPVRTSENPALTRREAS